MKRYGGERSGDLRGLVVRAGQDGHGGAGVEVMDPSWLMTARLRGAVSGVNTDPTPHQSGVVAPRLRIDVTRCYVLPHFAESFAVSCGGSLVGPWM